VGLKRPCRFKSCLRYHGERTYGRKCRRPFLFGDELKSILTPEEYDSAKRTTYSQFFTSPIVMQSMHEALSRLGVPESGLMLEPGRGVGNFIETAPGGQRFIGVEFDSISGRIARTLHPRPTSGSRTSAIPNSPNSTP
jgi:hypothetical protein